ncbi:Uncharacterised protein [Vibrio cholerae]|nr:Uncharacterised protein [Vibrio cholerae]CSB83131.1 Uncharacterised protein [Vibrio cholerae]
MAQSRQITHRLCANLLLEYSANPLFPTQPARVHRYLPPQQESQVLNPYGIECS